MIRRDASSIITKQGKKLPCFYYTQLTSSNYHAKVMLSQEEMPDRFAILCKEQSAGVGRYDRVFLSPKGGVYMTYVRKVPTNVNFASLGLYSALGVVRALKTLGVTEGVSVKWPNDIKLNGGKVCGILPESVVRNGETYVLIGIGLNVNTRADKLTKFVDGATSIFLQTGRKCKLKDAFLSLPAQVDRVADEYFDNVEALHEEYLAYCETVGKTVRFTSSNGEKKEGVAQRINADGSVTVMTDCGKENISWGELNEQ